MTILYPVAANAEQALAAPKGRAIREREARLVAGEGVTFVTQATGPAFSTRAAALDAYRGLVEDERSGFTPAIEDRWRRLIEQVASEALADRPLPVAPIFAGGRRWPEPKVATATVWRLSISFWRIGGPSVGPAPQAREARRSGEALDAEALRAIVNQPLQAVKLQQPLDIGLFEVRLPENPSIVVPDE